MLQKIACWTHHEFLWMHSRRLSTAARASSCHYYLAAALQSFTVAGNLLGGATVHARMTRLHDLSSGSYSLWNKLLKFYLTCDHPHIALLVFEQMPDRDTVSYNTLISAHNHCSRHPTKGTHLYSRMLVEGVKPNAFTISALLSGYNCSDSPSLFLLLHCHSIKLGLSSDGFVGGALVNHYERLTGLEDAVLAFKDISHVDEVSWNIMIDACARSDSKKETVCVFSRMRWDGGGFDSFALTSVLKTCLERMDLSLGMQLHGSALKVGLNSDTAVGNALITMYSRCGNGVDSFFLVFNTIHEPNIITWTALIGALLHHKMAKEAINFYRKMLRSGILENEFCFSSVLPAFGEFSSVELGRMVHSRILKSTFQLDVGVGNAVMDMYFKCGIIEDAQLVFQTMTKIDVVSWTTIISGFGQHGKGREALKLFRMMEERGFIPDGVTFLGALSACSHGGLVDEGIKVFKSMVDVYCMQPRKEHFACVVDLFGRAGRLNEADSFIEEMGLKSDALVWETLLAGCELHGEVELGKKSAERVMELKPGEDLPYVSLSNIYAEKKMWKEKVEVRKRLDASGSRKDAAQSWV